MNFFFSKERFFFFRKRTLLKLIWNFYYPEKSAPNHTFRTKENEDKESKILINLML
jgi:hypothetical protein